MPRRREKAERSRTRLIAIIAAAGRNDSFEGLQEYYPVPLLPLADKPFLQHIVEYLASQDVRRFEFILSNLPEKIESALGDGARWGCGFSYHLLPLDGNPLRVASAIAATLDDIVVLGNAECLPELDLAAIPPSTLIARDGVWTGWGVFTPADFKLPDIECLQHAEAVRYLSIESGQEFLRSQRLVLDQAFPGLLIAGRQADPGIWICRNVALHPTAKLNPPVYIGENCRIGGGAKIGPSAVIGQNCMVGAHTIILNSMVAPGTYVGEGLELDAVIVDRNRLLNIRLGTSILTSDTFLLGSLTGRESRRNRFRVLSSFAALVILFFLWPVLLLTWLYLVLARAGALASKDAIHIPADDDPATWRAVPILNFSVKGRQSRAGEFFFYFLPGLISVLGGRLFLVGVKPRSRAELLALPSDWRSLYLRTKAGLITEAEMMFGNNPLQDELYTAESFYSATESVGHDCRLFGLWLWKTIAGFPKSENEPGRDA